jgi:hypothetical protein
MAIRENLQIVKKRLQTVKKLLTEYDRLANKFSLEIPQNKLKQLDEKRNLGTIKGTDLPATLKKEIPRELIDLTLNEVEKMFDDLKGGRKND